MTKKYIFQYTLGEREQKPAIYDDASLASFLEVSTKQCRFYSDSFKQESEFAEVRLLNVVNRRNGQHYSELIGLDVQSHELGSGVMSHELLPSDAIFFNRRFM